MIPMEGNRKTGGGPGARVILASYLLALAAAPSGAALRLHPLFGDHMVLQRGVPATIRGTASPGEKGTLTFGGQSVAFTADAGGQWRAVLAAMPASVAPRTLALSGANSVSIADVLVGDVWLCGGQSNMAFSLGGTGRAEDIASADFPGLRQFSVPLANSGVPLDTVAGKWTVCSPATAAGFSAVAFHFGRRIQRELGGAVPIALLVSSVGGTHIEPWLAPEGLADQPALRPLLSQPILPFGPFSLFNGMIHPLAPYGLAGILWYQGENAESTRLGPVSYHQKMKALAAGWRRLFGQSGLPFYFVQIAAWLAPSSGPAPEAGGWPDTRWQQTLSLSIPRSGMAVTLDVGEADDIHPKDKLDVGERLALWALRDAYGRPTLIPGGPTLKDITRSGGRLVCEFEMAGTGLMAGAKQPYEPVRETPGAALRPFSIAGADGVWHDAEAAISGNLLHLSSPAVADPRQAAYAHWINPQGSNLYNREGLPAAPFLVRDVTARHAVTATAGAGGSVQPAGVRSYLAGGTARYAFVPEAGYFLSEVRVDGSPVGSPEHWSFDPLDADHAVAASFSRVRPAYRVRAVAGPGAALAPSGDLAAGQGEALAFRIGAPPGCRATLTVDGIPFGERKAFALHDIRRDHDLSVSVTCPITAYAGFGGSVLPAGTVHAVFGSTPTYSILPASGFAVGAVRVDGADQPGISAYVFAPVEGPHVLTASFAGTPPLLGVIPRPDRIVFAALADSLRVGASASPWPTYLPRGGWLTPLGRPAVDTLDGKRYSANRYYPGDGYLLGSFAAPIPCEGASVVVVARPERNGVAAAWSSLVNVFHDRLSLGIRNDDGRVCVLRNGRIGTSTTALPDGSIVILSLVAQPDGSHRVFADGKEIFSEGPGERLEALVPGVPGPFADRITVGRSGADAWSVFNGQIGDVFLYKSALSEADRRSLEDFIRGRIMGDGVPVRAEARVTGSRSGKGPGVLTRGRGADGRLRRNGPFPNPPDLHKP